MLIIDDLAPNHRRIYEAVRDAGKAVSPAELEELTGIAGTTVRPTVRAMEERGYLERVGYGMYAAVPLDQVRDKNISPYDTGLTPPGSTVQNPTPKTHHATSPKPRDDMEIPGEWLGPIITGAMLVVFDRSSFERVAAMRIKGRRYRLRIELDDVEGEDDKPPEQPAR